MPTSLPTVRIFAAHPACMARAERIARQTGLPMTDSLESGQLILRVDLSGLDLLLAGDPMLGSGIRAEFVHGRTGYRIRMGRQEPLLRAAGLQHGSEQWVVDATGGLGRDGFLLASAGCRVDICERHPVVAMLLADGLERALAVSETETIARRLRLHREDARSFLGRLALEEKQPDIIYLDPMFPPRKKSALNKKELHLLQRLLGSSDPGADHLLGIALSCRSCRVVVKRPLRAPWLADRNPSWSIQGRTVRFDVYRGRP